MRRTLGLAAALAACAPKAVVVGPSPTTTPAASAEDRARTDSRRASLLARLGGAASLNELLRPDDRGGPALSGRALEAYAEGAELKAVQLARAALSADPSNAARRRMLDVLTPVTAPVPTPPAAPAATAAPREDRSRIDERRTALLARLGDAASLGELLRPDDLDGPLLSGVALEAYAEGSELKAVLFAQAALGADLGNATRRRFLNILAVDTGIPFDPEGVLPPAALVQHELARAEAAFFEKRFGAAAQFCRRALLVSPEDAGAWTRLGSTYFAVGDETRARQAYAKALTLDPDDPTLTRFLTERGWLQ